MMKAAASYSIAQGLHSNKLMHELDLPPKESIKERFSGGWSFIEELANNPSPTPNQMELPVRLRMTRSLSTLSSKSLEMCTESLGSETGFDNTETIEEISSYLSQQKSRETFVPLPPSAVSNRFPRTKTFPPPLTSSTGRGSDEVKVMRPHREGGRLVLVAISVIKPNPLFQADRTNGRLRLSFKMANRDDEEREEDPEVGSQDGGEDDDEENA
ncbi:unnamed protein product [Cuscuta campestris]|uniref:FAF domain-containing protein n=1 Tax=Cuscuta campestris TaxID=132261 RepID=A0A484LDB5_9ASTE|nr:unnamed protein product [Cuscuta campestris]